MEGAPDKQASYENEEEYYEHEEEYYEHEVEDDDEYGGEGMTVLGEFDETRTCSECGREIVLHFVYDESVHEQEREMGDDILHIWSGEGTCPTCNNTENEEIEESIYVVAGGAYALNAEEREGTIALNRVTFSMPSEGPAQLTVFDQGKGDSLLLVCGSTLIFYDTGYKKYFPHIHATLAALDLELVDNCIVIVSHPDADHAGGYNELISYLDEALNTATRRYVLFESATAKHGYLCNVAVEDANNHIVFDLSDLVLHCYLSPEHTNPNDRSIVVVVEHGESVSCFTGDQRLPTVLNRLNRHSKPLFAFQVPHHGSLHNYCGAVLPQASIYVVSGSPNNDPEHNRNCQRKILESACVACTTSPYRVAFTRPLLSPQEIHTISEGKAELLHLASTVIRIPLP